MPLIRYIMVVKMYSLRTYRWRVVAGIQLVRTAIIIVLFLLPACTNAQQGEEPEDLTQLDIEDLLNIKVTSASKKVERTIDAPASVTVITHDQIERYGYRNLQDALRSVVGLYTSTDLNYEYIGVRGYSMPGDYNTRVLILIDGVRLNDPTYAQAPIGEDMPIDIRSVERIEIVKGPGSALWGNNAVLAVINLITRKSDDMQDNQLVQSTGTLGSQESFFEFHNNSPNGFQFAGSMTSMESDGSSSIYFPAFDSPETNNGFAQNLDGESAWRGYLSGSYGKLKMLFNVGDRRKDIPTASYDTVFNQSGSWTDDSRSVLSLSYETKCSTKRNDLLSVQFYSNRYTYQGSYIYDYGYPTLVTESDYASASWFGIETRYSLDVNSRLSVTSGLEYTHSRMRQECHNKAPYFLEYLDISCNIDTKSCYTQADLTISDPLRMVVGLRIDDTSEVGTNLSPRAALIYSASSSTTLKMLYGEAFRAPCWNEGFYLEPEKIATTELVLERALGTHSRFVTSLFHYDLDQIIAQTTDSDGNLQYVNLTGYTSDGIEAQLESRVLDGIDGYLGFTVLRTRDSITDERISNSPRYLVTAGLSLPVARHYIISPDLQLVGSRTTLAGNETGSALVCNLAMKTIDRKGLGLSAGVYNLFDKTIYAPGSDRLMQDEIPQGGRTFHIQATYRY